jgi:hypothetical protein
MVIGKLREDIEALEWQQQALVGPIGVCDGGIEYPQKPCVSKDDIRSALREW